MEKVCCARKRVFSLSYRHKAQCHKQQMKGIAEYNEANANGWENLKIPKCVSLDSFRDKEILIRVEVFREPLRR